MIIIKLTIFKESNFINVEIFLIHEVDSLLESLREFVVAKVKNNAQNKALTDRNTSNAFIITQEDFERIVRSEKFSTYIFTLFDQSNSGYIDASSMIELLQFNIG